MNTVVDAGLVMGFGCAGMLAVMLMLTAVVGQINKSDMRRQDAEDGGDGRDYQGYWSDGGGTRQADRGPSRREVCQEMSRSAAGVRRGVQEGVRWVNGQEFADRTAWEYGEKLERE